MFGVRVFSFLRRCGVFVGWRLRMALSNGTLRVVSTRVEGGVTAVKRRVGFFCTVVEEDICVGCNGGREEE